MEVQVFNLTTRYPGIARSLEAEALIAPPFDFRTTVQPPPHEHFKGIWDTGATSSVISQAVVDRCALQRVGYQNVFIAEGSYTAEVYVVNLVLRNNLGTAFLTVTKGNLPPGIDFLLGMDIISTGDFAVTNAMGQTVLTFRQPSVGRIDFTAPKTPPPPAPLGIANVSRNSPCPCGSKKKYKKCCGLKARA